MKSLSRRLAIAGAAASLLIGLGSYQAQAQNRGNFDPAEFQKRMQERMREQFDVKDDGEWKIISERITKVTDAQREVRGGFGGFGGFGGRGPGGPGGGGGDNANAGGDGNRRGPGGPGGFGGNREPNPEAEALQKAIQDKASNDEIKAKLAKFRESRKEKQAKLEKAQEELKQVLSVRQEAVAVTMGLLQ